MIKDNKSDEMYSEKQRSDREIIDMVTMAGITFEDEESEAPAEVQPSKIEKAGNKAKDFLSNIFPFED